MGELIEFPGHSRPLQPYEQALPLIVNGYRVTCLGCKALCDHAGYNFLACTKHTQYNH